MEIKDYDRNKEAKEFRLKYSKLSKPSQRLGLISRELKKSNGVVTILTAYEAGIISPEVFNNPPNSAYFAMQSIEGSLKNFEKTVKADIFRMKKTLKEWRKNSFVKKPIEIQLESQSEMIEDIVKMNKKSP